MFHNFLLYFFEILKPHQLLLAFELDGIMKNRGFHTTSETSDRLSGLKSTILNLNSCADYATSFNSAWESWNKDDLTYPSEISGALALTSIRPSQYWLVGFIFQFLWQVTAEDGFFQRATWPVTNDHLNYLLDSRRYILQNHILLDTSDIKTSLINFLQSTIDRVDDSQLRVELTGWLNIYKPVLVENHIGAKYAMLVRFEEQITCDGNSPADQFLQSFLPAQLETYYEPSDRAGFIIAIRDMADLAGITESVNFGELWYGPESTFNQDTRNPTTAPHISTLMPSTAGNPCPSETCWTYDENIHECALKSDGGCFEVKCDYNDFHLTFKSDLFGIENAATGPFQQTDPACAPSWNAATGEWNWKHELGNCGMEVAKETSSAGVEQFLFKTAIVTKSEFNAVTGNDKQISLTFQCHYKAGDI